MGALISMLFNVTIFKFFSASILLLSTEYYQDSVDELRRIFNRLDLILIGDAVIRFADSEVERICIEHWDINGDGGLSASEASKATEISYFAGTNITSFDEFKHFTSVEGLPQSVFKNCLSLTSITLPNSLNTIPNEGFRNCSALSEINFSRIKEVGWRSFADCRSLAIDLKIPLLETIQDQGFSSSGIVSASNLGVLKSIGGNSFSSCPNLKYVILPPTLTKIGSGAFYDCKALEYTVCEGAVPPTLVSSNAFNSTSCIIYVPDESLEAYKTASEWSRWVSRIKPLSEKPQ